MSKQPIGFRILRNDVEVDAVRYERAIIKIGKAVSSTLKLDDPSVSRMHCIVEVDESPSVIDLGSQSGTHVNGVKVNKSALRTGDRIDIRRIIDTARTREDLDELIGTVLVVMIDKVREKRAEPASGELYTQAIEALGGLRVSCAGPSLLVELMHGLPKASDDPLWRPNACAAIATHPACWPYLERVADLSGYAIAAARAAVRAGRDVTPWLAHPFWQVRLAAARAVTDDVERTAALASVWDSFARSDVPVEGNPRDGHQLRLPRPTSAWRRFDWRAAAAQQGIEIATLPELPALVAGLESPCADLRSWTMGAIDRRRDVRELVELGIADVLDAARGRAGWPRTLVDWAAWRRVVPDLPVEPGARQAWLVTHASRRGELAASAITFLISEPPAFEPPHLVLDADSREAVLDNERCELLAALIRMEAVAKQAAAEGSDEAADAKTPVLPDVS